MLYVILIIIGLGIGSLRYGESGPIIGGLLGFLAAWLYSLNKKLKNLQQQFNDYKQVQNDSIELSPQQAINPEDLSPEPIDTQSDQQFEALDADLSKTSKESDISEISEASNPSIANAEIKNANEIVEPLFDDEFNQALESETKESESKADFQFAPNEFQNTADKVQKPDFIDLAMTKTKDIIIGYFTGGNALVRTGMLVLFVGIAFLLKYVAQHTTFPVEYRYYAIIVASFVMLFFGWKLRNKRRGYALSIQGGGIGLLYLTLFAAMRIHNLLDPKIVLILLIAIVIITAVLAVIQDSLAFAVIGMIGGFAAPILTSTGQGSHVHLFSYYLLLNFGIFVIAWFKSWRILNVVGFIATFGVGTVWGYQYYKPQFFNTVEPFLIAYFVMYTIIAVLFALKQAPKLRGINDSTLVFGTPLVAFGLQAALLKNSEYGLAYSAIALSGFYLLITLIIKLMKKPYIKTLIESFIALAIGFATLAIPLAFDGRVTSAMWVLEAAAMSWVGIKQNRVLPRFAGYLLMALGTLAYIYDPSTQVPSIAWFNADYIGVLIIVISTGFIGLYARKKLDKLFNIEVPLISNVLIITSVLWWSLGGAHEINQFYPTDTFVLLELFFAITIIALLYFCNSLQLSLLKHLSLFVALLMIIAIPFAQLVNFYNSEDAFTPVLNYRFIGLLIFSLTYYLISWFYQRTTEIVNNNTKTLPSIILFIAIFTWVIIGLFEIKSFVKPFYELNVFIVFILLSFILNLIVASKLNWQTLKYAKYLLLVFCIGFSFVVLEYYGNFHVAYGLLVWLIALVVNYAVIKRYQNNWKYIDQYHMFSLWLFSFIVVFEGGELFKYLFGNQTIWHITSYSLVLVLISFILYQIRNLQKWPIATFYKSYYQYGLPVMVICAWLIVIGINISPPGQLSLIKYIPVINIIDLTSLATVFLIWKMFKQSKSIFFIESKKTIITAIALTLFLIINASMLRCFHYWYGISYTSDAMFSSFMVQMGLSILWTISAVSLMIYATKKNLRQEWMVGMGLIIVVVIKLFLVDMSASGTIERIVTFLTVGILLSLVGYFSPLPPEIKAQDLKNGNVSED